jgi:hypothetical protein
MLRGPPVASNSYYRTEEKKKQKTVDKLFPAQSKGTELQHWLKLRARYSSELAKTKVACAAAVNKSKSDWAFKNMIADKENHNVH